MFGLDTGVLFFIAMAIALFIVEILTITFYAFFLSVASFVVAACLYNDISLIVSLIIGGTLALICSIVFQRTFQKKRFQPAQLSPFENLVGQKGTVSESIDAQSLMGTVVIGGTAWRVRSGCAISQGEIVLVTKAGSPQDMILYVEKV